MAAFHDRDAGYGDSRRHREAADDLWSLIDKLEALPENDPAFMEMAEICMRTECRCQAKDDRFFELVGWAVDYDTTTKFLDEMLANYRRVDRQEAAAS